MALRPLGFEPGSRDETEWHDALSNAFAAVRGKVCATCGLEGVGHGPESSWLGYVKHDFDGIPADEAMEQYARDLSALAYRARRETGQHLFCGHAFPSTQCREGKCAHIAGHCEHCLAGA